MTSPRYAVISVGTNSCRLLIARDEQGALRVDYHESRGTRLGENVNESHRLLPAAVDRTLDAVRDYARLSSGAQRVFGIGTSALREAQDPASFTKRFEEAAGVPLTILSGEEEASASFAGALAGLKAAGRSVPDALFVVDVGGGSTEVATRSSRDAQPTCASLQIGAVRLTESYLTSDPPTEDQISRCRQTVRAALAVLPAGAGPRGAMIAVGGTATTAARVLQLVEENAVDAIADVASGDLAALLKAVISLPAQQRRRLRGLPAQRADIFPAGLLILNEIAAAAHAPTIVVSGSDLLLGYLAQSAR